MKKVNRLPREEANRGDGLPTSSFPEGSGPTDQDVEGHVTPEGQGLTLSFDSVLLHSLCRLLQSAVKKSDWDMELKLPGTEQQEGAERGAVRTLN